MPGEDSYRRFGLLELATACAFLVILLGLAVSLARYVRVENGVSALAEQMTMLNAKLEHVTVPADLPLFAAETTADDERHNPAAIQALARQNATDWAALLGVDSSATQDVWGSPIVLVNGHHSALGMAPHMRPFFLSAGPDGRYFTIADNIYGYDVGLSDLSLPTTRPDDGGHREQ